MSEGAGTVVRTQTDVRVRPSPLPSVVHLPAMGWPARGVGTSRDPTTGGVDRSHGDRTRGGDPAPTTYRESARHARSSTARTRSPTRSIAGVTTTHVQTTPDA